MILAVVWAATTPTHAAAQDGAFSGSLEIEPVFTPANDARDLEPTTMTSSPSDAIKGLNIVYLYGGNWNLGRQRRDVLTLEYYRNTPWGDVFTFVDITYLATAGDGFETEYYGEISPRLSLNKLLGWDLSFGPVKEVLISNTLELGAVPGREFYNHLHGVGFGLDVPGFKFVNVDAYLRNDPLQEGATWQVTFSWGMAGRLGGLPLTYGGFVDIAGPEGDSRFNVVSGTRLMVNLGELTEGRSGPWSVGVELAAWYNEFGINNTWELVPQVAFQYSF